MPDLWLRLSRHLCWRVTGDEAGKERRNMSRIGQVWDSARQALEARQKREEAQQRQEALRMAVALYDVPPDKAAQEAMREALAVEHGTPWLRAVVDVGRQLQRQHMDTIASRPGTQDAIEAGYRFAELIRLEAVLLEAVDKAREGMKK